MGIHDIEARVLTGQLFSYLHGSKDTQDPDSQVAFGFSYTRSIQKPRDIRKRDGLKRSMPGYSFAILPT